MNIFYTYVYFDPSRNNEPFYVGKGKKRRAYDHLKRKDRHPLTHRIQKMLREGVEPLIKLVLVDVTAQDAIAEEIRLIGLYGRKDLGTGTLLNMTDGGDGQHNYSPETLLKMSLKHKGRKLTDEHKEKLRIASTGRVKSEEEISKLKASKTGVPSNHKGRKHTETACKNMSASAQKRKDQPGYREMMSAANVGKKRTEAQKLNNRAIQAFVACKKAGREYSDLAEHRAKQQAQEKQ